MVYNKDRDKGINIKEETDMIKLTNLIVDQNYRLIGFTGEGKAKDFGELSTEKVTRPISMKYIFDTNFSNKQIAAKRGVITEKDGFKLNSLPMLMLSDTGYVPVQNTIELTTRYVQNNEIIGFGVIVGKEQAARFTYENTLKMCDLFKPLNFVIRYGKDNKRFIAGKPGCSLSELPMEVIGSTTDAKRTKPTTKKAEAITGNFVNEVDILDLYDFVRNVNGFIINLPGTKYKITTESAAAAMEFVPFNIGEVGTPWLDFNETKFNVSCNFKKPGAVAMELQPHKRTNVITFVYRRKNIFFNGDNYIQKLGVVIPNEAEESLLKTFGRSMSFTPITDAGMISPISMLIAQTNVKFYEVDTSKIGIIAKSKLDSLIIPTQDIYSKVLTLTQNKFITKYLNGLVKELKEAGCVTTGEKIKDIAPQFAAMSNEELVALTENGIDIYTGAFTSRDESNKTSGVSSDETVEVAYAIDGLSVSSLTYKQMVAGGDKVPNFLATEIAKFNSIKDLNERGKKARETLDALEKSTGEIKRVLWLHKCAMYLKSNKTSVHSHDKRNWELNTKKRTKAKCYNCRLKNCERLQLLVSNIDI